MHNFLYRLNPISKIEIMLLFAIVVSFSKDIFFPASILLFFILSGSCLAGLHLSDFWRGMKAAVIAAVCLCIFILVTRSFNQQGDIQLGMFGILYRDLEQASSLALRMLGFAYAGFLFSRTTDPVALILNLIKYWRIPIPAGYAFLTAYRFVPTFHDELQKIQLAHEVRGGQSQTNRMQQAFHLPKYLVTLMIQAIRTGERVSLAMDARSFCLTDSRTFYKEVYLTKNDHLAVICCLIYILIMLSLLCVTGLFTFGVRF